MDKIRLIEEPDCWCGPNSQLATPKDFPEISEDHFALDAVSQRDLEQLLHRQPAPAGASGFQLRDAPPAHLAKQQQLKAALDRSAVELHAQPAQLQAKMRELWRLNNIEVYDLSTVDYDHLAALQSNFPLLQPLDASDSHHLTLPRFQQKPRQAQAPSRPRTQAPAPSFGLEDPC